MQATSEEDDCTLSTSPCRPRPSVEELYNRINLLKNNVKKMRKRTESLKSDMGDMNRRLNYLEDEVKECLLLDEVINTLKADGDGEDYCTLRTFRKEKNENQDKDVDNVKSSWLWQILHL